MSSNIRKVAIVTGSARGIGKAIALRLARDGFNVVVSDLETQFSEMQQVVSEIDQLANGTETLTIPCDVSKEEQVQKLVGGTVSRFGRLDCVSVILSIRNLMTWYRWLLMPGY